MSAQTAPPSARILVFYVLLGLASLSLIGRLFYLQILDQERYALQAFENRVTRISDPAPRGIIYDRNGVALVRNVPSFNITIVPAELPENPARVQAIYNRLAELLDMPLTVPGSQPQAPCTPGRGVRDLVQEGAGFRPYEPVKIKCDVDKSIALVIREEMQQMPGVGVQVEPVREYPTGPLTSTFVGYLAPIPARSDAPLTYDYYTQRGFLPHRDRIGVAGVEASLQDVLAGQNGSRLVERDVAGQVLRVLGVETPTVAGNNIQLTIDVQLQAAAEAALTQRIRYFNAFLDRTEAYAGVVIVMDPRNGDILAMVSWPSYDNNRFARSIDYDYYVELAGDPNRDIPGDPFYPLLNHGVSILYPPGSVFKVVTAAAVLEEGVINPNRELEDQGRIIIRDQYFPADRGRDVEFVCWNRQGHGMVSFVRGIAESCNVYFYKIGGGYGPDRIDGLGIERLGEWMTRFGMGRLTNVQLPGEVAGFIPSRDWKRITWGESWSTGDTYNAVIGQGYVHVTPLQMLNAYNAIINGGWLYQPNIIGKILDGEGNVVEEPAPVLLNEDRLPLSDETLNLVRAGMRQAVTGGTLGGTLDIFGQPGVPMVDVPEDLHVAGKTGTAEFCDSFAYPLGWCIPRQFPTHSWTALYGPYDDPEVSVIVFVYHGGEGSQVAAPIAGNVIRAYFALKEARQNTP
jgi:penicillin-binding protein 2